MTEQNPQYLIEELEAKVIQLIERVSYLESRLLDTKKQDNLFDNARKDIKNLNFPKSISQSFGTIGSIGASPQNPYKANP